MKDIDGTAIALFGRMSPSTNDGSIIFNGEGKAEPVLAEGIGCLKGSFFQDDKASETIGGLQNGCGPNVS